VGSAAPESISLQVVERPENILLNGHCNCETEDPGPGETVMVPGAPFTAWKSPSEVTPKTLLTGSAIAPVLSLSRLAVTTATTPLLIGQEFPPVARQVTTLPELHIAVFPAAVAADPAATVNDLRFPGFAITQCRPASNGSFPY
jgi:hypothetical protein